MKLLIGVIILLSHAKFYSVAGDTSYFIVPTVDSPCPEGLRNVDSTGSEYYEYGGNHIGEHQNESIVCLTLEQYVRLNNVTVREIQLNQTLKFVSGEHHLNSVLDVSKITELAMISEGSGATITCSSKNAKILFKSIKNVVMSGLEFIECEKIDISYTNQFTLVNSSIEMSQLTLYKTNNATFINCTFLCTQGSCDDHTQTTLVIEMSSVALIQNCVFTGLMGPALHAWKSDITIKNSIFEKNVVEVDDNDPTIAIASVYDSDFWLFQSQFVDNSGRALYIATAWDNNIHHQIVMDQNIFTNNQWSSYYSITAVEFAISDSAVSIRNCSFTNNYGFKTLKIGVWDDFRINMTASVIITGCAFLNNTWPLSLYSDFLDSSAYVHQTVTLLIEWTNFTGNSGPSVMIVIDAAVGNVDQRVQDTYSLTIFQSLFVSNEGDPPIQEPPSMYIAAGSVMIGAWNRRHPSYRPKIIRAYSLTLVINESSFMHNVGSFSHIDTYSAFYYKDEIVSDMRDAKDQTISILHSKFVNNTGAGAIATVNGHYNLSITDCLFVNHSAEFCGVLALSADTTTITASTFSNNHVWRNGGVICTLDRAKKLSISNSTFSNNYAETDGGVLSTDALFTYFYSNSSIYYVNADISNCSFINNKAGRDGGVMHVIRSVNQVTIRGSSFSSNSAMGRGGVISIDKSDLEVTNSMFFNNSAEIGEVISSCDSNVSTNDMTDLFQYEHPNFPQCVFYSSTTNLKSITTTSLRLSITPTIAIILGTESVSPGHSPGPKPPLSSIEHPVQLWIIIVAISAPFVCIVVLVLITAFVLGYLCRRRGTLKCYKHSTQERKNHHGAYVPLINNYS